MGSGGMLRAIEIGYVQREIQEAAYQISERSNVKRLSSLA